jgi:hypothetical protein
MLCRARRWDNLKDMPMLLSQDLPKMKEGMKIGLSGFGVGLS